MVNVSFRQGLGGSVVIIAGLCRQAAHANSFFFGISCATVVRVLPHPSMKNQGGC
jgi:hypothetical protein